MATFSALGIRKDYIQSIKEIGISKPSEIQEKAIPILLNSKTDFIGLAQTGTGKTAAFGLPVLHQIDSDSAHIQALILSPTRELVQQIKKQLFKFTKYVDEKIFLEAVFGGEKIDKQINNLKRITHIVVATPGRLIDLIERGDIDITLEGDMQQKERDKVMRAFKNESLQYLISTDVSARGIDVRDLEFVIHHQLPEQTDYYTHRSGRTARAGKTGISLALVLPYELERVHELQKELHIKFTEVTV
ncbi:UNVERIFIED_CONTAM: hypothetical protein GTU68_020904 [Idotea baltica]|nr:hypothetical protein [Idotea baltica]